VGGGTSVLYTIPLGIVILLVYISQHFFLLVLSFLFVLSQHLLFALVCSNITFDELKYSRPRLHVCVCEIVLKKTYLKSSYYLPVAVAAALTQGSTYFSTGIYL